MHFVANPADSAILLTASQCLRSSDVLEIITLKRRSAITHPNRRFGRMKIVL